jgi:ABC-type polysaccharide/polyol phosphate export permease
MTASFLRAALTDFFQVFRQWRTWAALGVHDVRMRYRRTVLGPLWISLSIGATFVSMGMLFSALFKTDVRTYLPYLGAGMILWSLATGVTGEAPGLFPANQHIIKTMRLPLSLHVARCVFRNAVIFLHHLAVFFVAALVAGLRPGWETLLIAASLPVFLLALYFVAVIIALLGARFRDIGPMIGMTTQFLFFLTPIIWSPEHIPDGRKYWVYANPVHHMIEIVRAPLLGTLPPGRTIAVALAFTALLGVTSVVCFILLRRRVVYWI